MGDHSALSQKKIPRRERLILALDVPTVAEAKALVERLGDTVQFYKVGLQLFMAGGYYELIEWLKGKNKQVFVDLKFFDVPETVKLAVAQLKSRRVTFATVHGNDEILKAAVEANSGVQILAVTVLTSLDRGDLADLGFECDVESLVLSRAKRALQIGCAGVISSGIRPVENKLLETDDQKRVADVEQAFRNGADYIVVGRPIRRAADPRAKAEEIQRTIAKLFTE